MVLYVSIVLLATLAALPAGGSDDDGAHGSSGVHGGALLGLIWGTTLGLALAHWFAFRVTARGFGGGHATRQDGAEALAQLGGATAVAVLCSLPVLLLPDDREVAVAAWVPAVVVGVGAYLASRVGGRSPRLALALGLVALVVGLAVAAVKNALAGH